MFVHLSNSPPRESHRSLNCYALNPLRYRLQPHAIDALRRWYHARKAASLPYPAPAPAMDDDSLCEQERALRANAASLRYDRSSIHQWGLFATRRHSAGEPLIEYVGELVRLSVVEKRQRMYEREGNNGSYIFRLSGDTYIDATRTGGKARFINHSCDPNCETKIMDLFGENHVVIVALRSIAPYEELVYDYKIEFEPKDKRIRCCCGALCCKGWLNWSAQAEAEGAGEQTRARAEPFSGLYVRGGSRVVSPRAAKAPKKKVVLLPESADQSVVDALAGMDITAVRREAPQ